MATSGTRDEGREAPTDDLYIKPKVVVEPDFTLHHYDIDHTAANYNSFEDYRYSLSFDGVSDYVHITDTDLDYNPDTQARSWSIWFLRSGNPHTQEWIFEHGAAGGNPGARLILDTNGILRFSAGDFAFGTTVGSSSTGYNGDYQWHLVVLTVDGSGNIKLYKDGGPGGILTSTYTVTTEFEGPLNLGRGVHESGYFEGLLDDFSYWTKILSAVEVLELYNAGPSANLNDHSAVADLKLWWRLGSRPNKNESVIDSSGNGYTGTNHGAFAITQQERVTPEHQRQAPFSKRFQLVRGAGAGRTTIG